MESLLLLFQALVTWLEHDPENRSKDASTLLGLVKLPLLSPAVSSLTAQFFT